MGRRLNTSRPTVIQTMLTPLSDSFAIQPSDTLEQWYYVNTGAYSPDRQSTPLQLKPTIVAVDTSTETIYHPSFAGVVWYYFDPSNNTDYSATDDFWPGLHWVRITAVEAETGGVLNDYYCPTTGNPDFKLYVQKNVTPLPLAMEMQDKTYVVLQCMLTHEIAALRLRLRKPYCLLQTRMLLVAL